MQIKVKGIVRYPHLVQPSSAKGVDSPQFSIQLLIHKSDPQCAQITKVFNEVTLNGFPNGTPPGFLTSWKDLAITDPGNQLLKDYMCLTSSVKETQGRPDLIDENQQPVIDLSIDKSAIGLVAYIVSNVVTYSKGSHGIKAYLNGVMLTQEKGILPVESLSSRPSVTEMFSNAIDMRQPGAVPMTTPPVAPPPVAPSRPAVIPLSPYQMTAQANGLTRDQYVQQGWTDEQLISNGLMMPPNGITPSFGA